MNTDVIWSGLENKLIAILRGIKSEETEAIVVALLDTGIAAIEIPLNSPDPIKSIEIAAKAANDHAMKSCLIGAGTVINAKDVKAVHEAGGNLIVSPNVDPSVITATKQLEMFSAPGVYTPTECLAALDAGADCLKVFPASNLGVGGIGAFSAVLPSETKICAVGGVGPEDFQNYLDVGVVAFGLGSSLYKPGFSVSEVAKNASTAINALNKCRIT